MVLVPVITGPPWLVMPLVLPAWPVGFASPRKVLARPPPLPAGCTSTVVSWFCSSICPSAPPQPTAASREDSITKRIARMGGLSLLWEPRRTGKGNFRSRAKKLLSASVFDGKESFLIFATQLELPGTPTREGL